MLNCLKSDFYRIIKGKTLYILLAVVAALSLFSVLLTFLISKIDFKELNEVLEALKFMFTGKYFFLTGLSSYIATFVAVFISTFICSDFSSGMMKNYVSTKTSRTKIFFSKFIACLTVAVVILLFSMLVNGLLGTIFFGFGPTTGTDFIEIFIKFLLEILLIIAYSSIFLFVAFSIRSTGGVIAVNILITILIGSFLTSIAFISTSLASIGDYWLDGNISYAAMSVYPEGLKDHLLSMLLTGTLYTTVFLFGSYMFFRFRDVK